MEGRRIVLLYENGLNSLWPDDAIWRQGSWSTLVQVMAWCLTAPSHCLNQCWLIISKVQSHSSGNHFTKDTSAINHWNQFENYLYKFSSKSPRGQWVNTCALHPATAYRMTVVESVKCLFVGVSDLTQNCRLADTWPNMMWWCCSGLGWSLCQRAHAVSIIPTLCQNNVDIIYPFFLCVPCLPTTPVRPTILES